MKQLLMVRYTGRDAAILAGSYIYENETRLVTSTQLAVAEAAHPDAFVVFAGERPALADELEGAEVSQPGGGDTTVPDETDGGETVVVQEPDLAPMPVAPAPVAVAPVAAAPVAAAPVAAAPVQGPSHSRHERRR